MGYYSTFELEVVEEQYSGIDHEENIAGWLGFNPFDSNPKWYDWENDMAAYSKAFPSVQFNVRREGEDTGDIAAATFLNGKSHHRKAEIVIPVFDKEKLKSVSCGKQWEQYKSYVKLQEQKANAEKAKLDAKVSGLSKLTEDEREALGL